MIVILQLKVVNNNIIIKKLIVVILQPKIVGNNNLEKCSTKFLMKIQLGGLIKTLMDG